MTKWQMNVEWAAATDLGNAERFNAQHGDGVRFVATHNQWRFWSGKRWEVDADGEVIRLAKQTVRAIHEEAARCEDKERRIALAKHAVRSESEGAIRRMIELAKTDVPIAATPEMFDRNPWLLNCASGIVDLRTGEISKHDPEQMITKLAPVEYNGLPGNARHWTSFLRRIQPDPSMREFLQRAIGYSLTGHTGEQCMFIGWGNGANGKGTLVRAIRNVLGDYAGSVNAEAFMVRQGQAIPNDLAALAGRRLVDVSESGAGRKLDEALVKRVTGDDMISCRFMRGEWFEYKPTYKLWLSTNSKPIVRGQDHGIWRRLRLIPFTVTIPREEWDLDLDAKLAGEKDAIFYWAVAGAIVWAQIHTLKPPPAVLAATEDYRAEMDILGAWISDRCELDGGAWTTTKALYESYVNWCEKSGENAVSVRVFARQLSERALEAKAGHGKQRGWKGIRVSIGGIGGIGGINSQISPQEDALENNRETDASDAPNAPAQGRLLA